MTCCIHKIKLCIGQSNDKGFLFTARDQAGDLLDLSDVQEITFVVASRIDGPVLLTKTKTGGAIMLNNAHQFSLTISDTESGALPVGSLYCEVGVVSFGGEKYTLGAGPFEVTDTRIWDA